MSCMLRAAGRTFDVDRYLRRSPFRPSAVHRRDTPVFPASQPQGRRRQRSGCNIAVSNRDFGDFRGQVRDAIAFLDRFARSVKALRHYPGVESVVLDFAVAWRDDVVTQSDVFPEPLVAAAGKLQLELAVSYYPVNGEPRQRPSTGGTGSHPGKKGAPLGRKRRRTTR